MDPRDNTSPPEAPPAESPPEPHHGIMARFRNYFLTGLVVAGPVAITLYLTWWFVTWVDGLVRPFVPVAYRPETYLPFGLPGSGLIVAVVALTLLGFLTANLIGRTLVDLGESLLGRIPAVRANHHDGRGGNVDADLDHGGRNQKLDFVGGERRHHAVLLGALHLAVDEPDLVAETLLETSKRLVALVR